MQMHPMVTVKKAANVLGTDKRSLRQKLASGELKGERRRVGSKRKWFIYAGEVEYLLEKQRLPELMSQAERTSVDGLHEFFEDDAEPILAEHVEESERQLPAQSALDVESIIEALTREFAYRLAEEHQEVIQLTDKMLQTEQLLKRLPDLELRLRQENSVNQSRELEITTLRTHVALLESTVQELKKPWWRFWF
jgi:hypothetical protein